MKKLLQYSFTKIEAKKAVSLAKLNAHGNLYKIETKEGEGYFFIYITNSGKEKRAGT